jgi:hypothetical protein
MGLSWPRRLARCLQSIGWAAPRINIVQMGRYGVGFVDVEEAALGICNHVKLAREPGGGVAGVRKFSHEIFRKRRRVSVY